MQGPGSNTKSSATSVQVVSAVEAAGVLVLIRHQLRVRRLLLNVPTTYVIYELILGGLCKSILSYIGIGFVRILRIWPYRRWCSVCKSGWV